jgi:hypothetical protein
MADQETRMAAPAPNGALLVDVCVAALRAFYNAPQRGRWASKMSKSPFEARRPRTHAWGA